MEIKKDDLKKEILNMASVVEEMLELLQDSSPQKNIYLLEDQTNRYHTQVDDLCFKYLALMRPLAKDLRAALAIMKMNNDLERIGDEAINIHLLAKGLDQQSLRHFQSMSEQVIQMLKNAINCFVTKNVKLAMSIIEKDQFVDQMYKDLIKEFIEEASDNENSKQKVFQLVLISKGLERIGDHATNIAEDVIFMVSGDDVRHSESVRQRVESQVKGDMAANDEKSSSIVNFLKKKDPFGE